MRQLGVRLPRVCGSSVADKRLIELAGSAANGAVLLGVRLIRRGQTQSDRSQRKVRGRSARRWGGTAQAASRPGAREAGGVGNYAPQEHNGLSKDAFEMVGIVDGKW
jgi:hypothetical protein